MQGRDALAVNVLSCYFNTNEHNSRHGHYAGAWFDDWDTTGQRESSSDRFTADDLVALKCLSVDVTADAARALLVTRADRFESLLKELGPDLDLVECQEPWADDWVGWELWRELMALPKVGPTTASKLYARKRPRLRPIYDSVVEQVIGSQAVWEPLRALLQEQSELHVRLLKLKAAARLPDAVSAIRVFDVLTWMEGKNHLRCARDAVEGSSS